MNWANLKWARTAPLMAVAGIGAILGGCIRGADAAPSTTADGSQDLVTTVAEAPTSTTSATTTTTTSTTTTTLPSEFAQHLAAGAQQVHPTWVEQRPVAGPATISDQWVAVAAYSDGARRDVVLDRRSGAELWSRVSTSSVASAKDLRVPPLVIDDVFIHLELDGAQSEGALLQGIDVTSGKTLWTAERPAWFPSPPFQCGPQRVCAVVWEYYGYGRKIVEYDTTNGQLVAQGPAGTASLLLDVDLVDPAAEAGGRTDYPLPPATIPGEPAGTNPPATPAPSDPPATAAPTQPATTAAATPAPTTAAPTTVPAEGAVARSAAGVQGVSARRAAVGATTETTAAPDSERTIVRFDGAGNPRWRLDVDELFPELGAGVKPTASLDVESDVLVVGSPAWSARPDQDTVYGIDYSSGQVLWKAQNRSMFCWQAVVRPATMRCKITGSIDTKPDDEGVEQIVGYRNVRVEFEVFDPVTGQTKGSVTASYPDWDGQGERPAIPSKVWYVQDGLLIQTDDGVFGLSTTDGEVLPLLASVVAWCEQGPVDDDGEIFPGFFPCESGDMSYTRIEGELSTIPGFVGALGDDGAVFVQDGTVFAVGFGPAPSPSTAPGSSVPDTTAP